MKTVFIFWLFLLLLSHFNYLYAQVPVPDENLGLGIVELSMDREESAKEYFRRSWSVNTKAILERIEKPQGPHHYQFNYDDPTLIGFYDYIVYVSNKPKYSFFAEIVKELDARNPNKELGKLGLFLNAYFSPRSTYLIVYTSSETIILNSKTGRLIELIKHGYDNKISDAKVIFSKDDIFMIRYLEVDPSPCEGDCEKKAKKIISYENYKTKNILWKKIFIYRVMVNFSKDYSKIFIFNFKAGADSSDYDIYEIDPKSGKEISKKHLINVTHDSMMNLFKKLTALHIDYFPDDYLTEVIKIESPDKKYLLMGNRTYGNFTLKKAKSNKPIRKLRFASDIE